MRQEKGIKIGAKIDYGGQSCVDSLTSPNFRHNIDRYHSPAPQ